MLIYKTEAKWKEGKVYDGLNRVEKVLFRLWIGEFVIGEVGYKERLERSGWEALIESPVFECVKVLGFEYETKEAAMKAVENYYEITEEEQT
jgi:hypothetical protein